MQTLQEIIIEVIVKKIGLKRDYIDPNENLINLNINPSILSEIVFLVCKELDIDYSLIDINKYKPNSINKLASILEPYIGLIF
ncbi:hypothetical protein [Desulfosporosinus nitroreducens]|uniref:hypothetical protein n=1 Tax=Desulfosporosinus nitroreducens TaxID=2018668 RepID=UPI00207D1A87|nr:hypothetical protein [Desulfosporosinus nitroreducens]MCO1604466.1 hypothetical protein [Desulfosporosinus nitroreducens]